MRLTLPLSLLAAAGCQFDRPADVMAPADAAVDARYQCPPDTIVCDDNVDRYVDCSADGTIEREIQCSLGCSDTEEKCIEIDPSNFFAEYLDMARDRTDVPALILSANTRIDTSAGTFTQGDVQIDVPRVDLESEVVFLLDSLRIDDAVVVTVRGPRALALMVDGEVEISGLFNAGASGTTPGPGMPHDGNCGGSSGSIPNTPSAGGGGGSRWTVGGVGGSAGNGKTGGRAGLRYGEESGEPLRPGCPGGVGAEFGPDNLVASSSGGGGGGAVQIVSRTRIVIPGVINISGGGGGQMVTIAAGNSSVSGGGGGSGGLLVLEAPVVSLQGPGAVLNARGGGGSAAGSGGGYGQDGTLHPNGGASSGHAGGGSGASETSAAQPGAPGATGTADGGGGGGGLGLVRFNTRDGTLGPTAGARIQAHHSVGAVRTRLVP